MRPLPIALAAALALLAGAWPAAADNRPKNIRVCVQFIEMPHPALTQLLAAKEVTGPALHDQAMALVKDGQARLLESCLVICRSGQKATVETIREVIYPAEYEPPQIPCSIHLPPIPRQPSPRLHHTTPTAFETRNAGVTFEIEPTLGSDAHIINLRLAPEVVAQTGVETSMEYRDDWGDASLRMPVFETWKTNTGVTLVAGQFEFVSVIAPKPKAPAPPTPREEKGGTGSLPVHANAEQWQHGQAARAPLVPDPAALRKILVFVRADVVPAGN